MVLARLYSLLLTIIIVLWTGVLLILDAALGLQGRDGSLWTRGECGPASKLIITRGLGGGGRD